MAMTERRMQNLKDEMDDIVSSGYGWSKWHRDELTEMVVKEGLKTEEKQELFQAYYNNGPTDGLTMEELTFAAKLFEVDLKTISVADIVFDEE